MKKTVDAFDYAGHICKSYPKGILITAKMGQQVNPMTIGWGTMGIEWGRRIFVAYVRDSRYTRQMLDESGEFTVNVPLGDCDDQILKFCGTKSGRDVDKVAHLGLTLEPGEAVAVPGIRELPLTLECKVLYRVKQPVESIPQDIQKRYYPQNAEGQQDFHYAYFAEIVNSYIIE